MTTLGRYPRNVADSRSLDFPYNALPGVDQDAGVTSNIPVWAAGSDLAATGTGVCIAVPVFLRAGDIVTSLTFVSGSQAAVNPTHWFHALYDPDGAKLRQSADQLTAAWAASAAKKLAMATTYTVTASGWYYASTSMTADTVVTLAGTAPLVGTATAHTGSLALGVTHGTAVAGTAPATIATPSTVAKCPLVIVS
jgi:hypothetical protein